jgi:hypothetical protein
MRSRLRARSLRLVLAAVVFAVILGLRIGPIPDDDNDPIVDYGPHLSSPLPARRLGALAGAAPSGEPHPGERTVLRRAVTHHLHLPPAHRKLPVPTLDPD